MTIMKVASEKHVLLFTMHHVVSDAWSTGVLIRELSELYQSFVAGHGSSLEPLAIQYADYAAWQRRWLEGESSKSSSPIGRISSRARPTA